ncbi:MAG TPA: Maf family protein [bacterium]|nr:septum formation protein Maf [Dictyoglomota bacterium]HOL54808.1 Maf family protein [bacterium]HON72853.1 Maf family protein [bacterium]HPO81919.1 Maf family protein [bacterium]HRR91926.1 Maf family protein [bacterium]
MRLILASSSPRRIELLSKLGAEFEVIPSNIIEPSPSPEEDPISFAKNLSFLKAYNVYQLIEEGVILGVDTIVEINNLILGKPKDREEARYMLRLLSGNTHRVISGFTIIDKKREKWVSDVAITAVKFRRLKYDDIENYLDTEDYIDKAGAYAIQGFGSTLVEYIRGCYYNVVGFPIERIMGALKLFLMEEKR